MFALPFPRFLSLKKLLLEVKEEETREKFILQAFSSWLNGAGKKKTFNQYLKHLGLVKKKTDPEKQLSEEEMKRIAARNIENAKKIISLDKRNREPQER